MKLFNIKKSILLLSTSSLLLMGSLYASDLIARGEHHPAAAHHATHPATHLNHGNYAHPAANYHPAAHQGLENRAFNRGIEAGALEGGALNGAGINGALDTGVINPNPVYITPTPTQPAVQYVVPTAAPVTPVTAPPQ